MTSGTAPVRVQPRLRAGDVVELRPAHDILATLTEHGTTGELPFMPEMLKFAGGRFTVTARALKVCDTTGGKDNRYLADTVLLDDLRCDGSAHGGCQAACRLFWRTAWLRPVQERDQTQRTDRAAMDPADAAGRELQLRVAKETVASPAGDPSRPVVYRCQATELGRASRPILPSERLRNYLAELSSGNVGIRRFARVLIRAASRKFARRFRHEGGFPLMSSTPPERPAPLNLRPGDLVRVRSREEILRVVDASGRTRGLTFDWEMLPHCGRSYRVRDRIRRIINESTGEMTEIASDCLTLDGVACSGDLSQGRWFCPRGVVPYWRESWLERVDGEG